MGVLWFCYGSEAPPEMEENMVFDGACISIMSLYLRKIYYPFVLIKIILISLPCQDCSMPEAIYAAIAYTRTTQPINFEILEECIIGSDKPFPEK